MMENCDLLKKFLLLSISIIINLKNQSSIIVITKDIIRIQNLTNIVLNLSHL